MRTQRFISMTNIKDINNSTFAFFVLALCGTVWAAADVPAPQPILDGENIARPLFGDERNVELFTGLLADEDERVRERSALELGQTHNPAALIPLRKAMQDASPAVRAAAIRGALELGAGADEILLQGLSDRETTPLLAALRACATRNLPQAIQAVAAHLADEWEIVQCAALQTLSALQQPAPIDDVARLLRESSPAVLVDTLNNALLLKDAKELQGDFIRLVGEDQPTAVQAAAVECLGAFVLAVVPVEPQPKPAAIPTTIPTTVPTTAPTTAPTSAPATAPAVAPAPVVVASTSPWASVKDYAQYNTSANPLLRRAAVRVYQRHGLVENILPFLADPSALVRQAAAGAMVTLPTPAAVEPLAQLCFSTPDDATHTLARQALQNTASPAVATIAAKHLPNLIAELQTNDRELEDANQRVKTITKNSSVAGDAPADPNLEKELQELHARIDALKRNQLLLQRNAMSCCHLLGVLKSKEGYGDLLGLSTSLPLNSPILYEVVVALGRIGDPQAIPPLQQVLESCNKTAVPYLQALTSMAAPPPFSEKLTGLVIQTLTDLGDRNSTEIIFRLARLNVMSMRLGVTLGHILDALPALQTAENQSDFEKLILGTLRDKNLPDIVHWKAIRLAGTMKLQKALPTLKYILFQQRECTSMMEISAWAIQQITGSETPPKLPLPALRQGDWIITQTE